MLKLYTNTEFLTQEHRSKVFPLLFDLHYLKNQKFLEYYSLVEDASNSDIVVFPIDYISFLKYRSAFYELQDIAKKNQKPIWIYTAGDYGLTNYIPNAYTFRLGGFDSKLGDNTFVIPSFINDPYVHYLSQGYNVLQKKEQPSIGFVGHAKSSTLKYIKELLNHLKYKVKRKLNILTVDSQSFYPSSIKRAQYLKTLSLNQSLNTNFILRDSYRAGVQNEDSKQKTTQEFYDNIFDNLYTFCIRGVGNFSVRFYETLAIGRIPILLNTDCRLPLSSSINWSEHCLILDEKSKVSLSDQVLNFHNNLSSIDVENIQEANRNLWINALQREFYFLKIHEHFKLENDNS